MLWIVLLSALVPVPRAQTSVVGQKVNGEITVTSPTVEGQVQSIALVPDSQRAVFVRGEGFFSNFFEVCVAPLDASALPLVLSAIPLLFGDIAVEVEPTGAGAVFTGRAASGAPVELFRAPLDGSTPAVTISASPGIAVFHVTPDGQRVLFVADRSAAGQFELFSAPIDGSAAPLLLSGTLVAGGDVATFLATATHAVYVADADTDNVSELYSVPVDGSAAPVRLNDPLIAAGDVTGSADFPAFRISPDGTRVVYRADAAVDLRFELFSVPIGGGTVALVSRSSGSNTRSYAIDPSGTRVAFADRPTATQWEVLSAPIDGSAPPVTLSGPFIATGAVQELRLTPDGARVVYRADQDQNEVFELFSAPIDGSAARVRINAALPTGGDVASFLVTSTHAVYRADQDVDGTIELFSAPVDGSAAPIQLHPPLVAGTSIAGGTELALTPDGQRAIFVADIVLGNTPEIVSAPVDGGGPLVVLDPNGDLSAPILVTPDSAHATYVSKEQVNYSFDAYSVPTGGGAPPVRFNENNFHVSGDVGFYALSERGDFAVYTASQETAIPALYATRLEAGYPNQRLSPDNGTSVSTFHLVPGGERVLFRQGSLYTVRLDGVGAPILLTDPALETSGADPVFTPDGTFAVYESTLLSGERALRRVRSDGSGTKVTLTQAFASITEVELTSDATTAVFVAAVAGQGWRIHSAPLVPGPTLTLTGDLADPPRFELTPDGARVVYHDDTAVDDSYEVYSVPVDGSAPPVRLSRPLAPGESVGIYHVFLYWHHRPFVISPDSTSVVFVANSEANGSFQLYRAPADGSAAASLLAEWPFVLDPFNEDGESVGSFGIDPRGERVVYQTGDRGQLYSIPLDGSGPAVELTKNVTSGRGVPAPYDDSAFRFAAGGTRVVYLSDHKVPNNPHMRLYSAPLGGGALPRELSGAMQAGGDVLAFETDGLDVVFIADREQDGRFRLYHAPASGGAVTRLSPPAVSGGRVWEFQVRRGQVLYFSDQDTVSVYELYYSRHRKEAVR